MPDTGAMICIAGVNIIHALGIKKPGHEREEFPAQMAKCKAGDSEEDNGRLCSCHDRETPCPPPQMPRGLKPEELESFIKEHYKTSAFNRCEKQALPVMEELAPCRLFIDPEAQPFAIH